MILGQVRGMKEHELTLVFHTSAMHDIGKLGGSDAILYKKGTLSPDECREMKRHI